MNYSTDREAEFIINGSNGEGGVEGEGGTDSDLRLSLLCVFLGGH